MMMPFMIGDSVFHILGPTLLHFMDRVSGSATVCTHTVLSEM